MDTIEEILEKYDADPFKNERYPVTWHVEVLLNGKRRGKKNIFSIGMCGYTNQIRSICASHESDTMLKMLAIRNVYVDERSCEDAPFCLNGECKFNQADHKRMRMTKKGLEKMMKYRNAIQTFIDDDPNFSLEVEKDGQTVWYENPPLSFS
jgi:hypothetical protein